MLYWSNCITPVVNARFEFKPEHAADFIKSKSGTQTIIEVAFESVEALIETVKSFEHVIKDCTAIIDGKIVSLSSFTIK